MGWGRMLLLGDVGQQLDIKDQREALEEMQTSISIERAMREGADELVGRLKRENQELKLYLAAVVRLLLAKKVVTVAEITNIVDVLDREDGKKDGDFGGPVVPES
jgi:hypothetical protein